MDGDPYARKWANDPKEPMPPHPAPEVPMRAATEDEVPTGAKRLEKLAHEHGWDTAITYARGTEMNMGTGRPGRVVDSIAVRFRHADGTAAYAHYTDGKAESAAVRFPGEIPTKLNINTLRALLRGDTEEEAA